MTLKLRASSQIKSISLGLSNLAKVESGTILGRSEDSVGEGTLSPISGAEVRKIAELHSDDSPQFASVTLTGDLSADNTVLSGNLTAASGSLSSSSATINNHLGSGSLSIGSSLTADSFVIANNMSSGSATITGDLSADNAVLSGDLTAASGTLNASAAVISNNMSASSATITGDLSADNAVLSGDLTAASGTLNASAAVISNNVSAGSATVTNALTAGSATIGSDTTIGGSLTVEGDFHVKGSTTTIDTANLYVEDPIIQVGKSNTTDAIDLGFVGLFNSSSYAGLVRDADDANKKFYLFETDEDLSTAQTVDFSSISKSTLDAHIEGNIKYDVAKNFSISGDIVANSVSYDGTGDVNLSAVIQPNSVEFSMLDCEIDENDMASDSNQHIPTQSSVKAYTGSATSSFGQSDLSQKDMLMVDSSGNFVNVKEIIDYSLISSDDESNDYVTVSTEIEDEFKELSSIYLNGQKLRYSSDTGTTNDYWFSETGASATKYSNDLTASDSASNDFFGSGVGLSSDGTVLSVGASRWEGSNTDQGGVYVYDWSDTDSDGTADSWVQRGDVITAPDAEGSDRFGESTSLNSDGSIMAAGAMFWDGNATNQGAAYVFEYNDTASFNSPTKYSNDLTASDQAASDQYGRISISQDGNVMSVGAFSWDRSDGGSNQGGVYIYDWTDTDGDGNGDTWVQRGSVFSPTSDATNNVRFGTSTSLSSDGTYLAVGALLYSDSATYQGAAFVYKWNSSTSSWDKQGSTIVAGDAGASDYHANVSINSDGTIISVGANLWDGASGSNHGAVYTYDWSDTDSDGTADTWVQRSSGDNIITNHDLSSGDLTGWTKQSGSNTTVDYFEYNSQDSIRLIPDNSTSGSGTWASVSQNVSYNFQSGTTYKLKFDVLHYTNADRNIVYGIAEVDSNGDFSAWNTVYNLDVDDAVPGVSTSGEISMEWTADADTSSVAQIRINHGGDPLNESGTIYVTNFRITDENDMVLTDNGGILTASDAGAADQFGRNISLSANGEILFVGSPYWEGDNTNQGGVYIYDWSSSNNSWVQRGDVLESNSPASNGNFGFALETNGDGTVLSVTEYYGSSSSNNIQIFDWNPSTSSWDYRTSISDHTTGTGNFGYSLSLSSDATKLAIADVGNGSTVAGKVFTYSITENPVGWNQKGSTIYQDSASTADLHTHVSISGNGLVLSVGVYAYDGSLTDQGATYIYDWNSSTSDWDQRGSVLIPSDAAAADYFGRDTSLSNDGSVLVIGSAEWEGDTSNQGGVYVYDWTDTDGDGTADSWVQRGDVLESNSPSANDYFGFSAQINSDATIMAVTKYQYASGGGGIGEVEIFDWIPSTSSWDYRYSIENPNGASSGTKNSTAFGYKVSLDGDGDFLVISERGIGDNFAGRVQTYSLSNTSTNNKVNFNNGVISENDKLEIRYIIKS